MKERGRRFIIGRITEHDSVNHPYCCMGWLIDQGAPLGNGSSSVTIIQSDNASTMLSVYTACVNKFDRLSDYRIAHCHRSIMSTVRYTALTPNRFKNFWKD